MKNNLSPESKVTYELDEEFALESIDNQSGISIVFKHDYYSSDNDHGRFLLKKLVDGVLTGCVQIESVFFVDTGVKLLDVNNPSHSLIMTLLDVCQTSNACSESIEYYNISTAVPVVPANELFILMGDMTGLLIVE